MSILEFRGENRWLSNFYYAEVHWDGWNYPTNEHAFQAAKTFDPDWRIAIRTAITPAIAKKMGRKAPLRPDWESVKLQVMETINREKFTRHLELRHWLLATNGKLEEGNNWGDTYWGTVNGQGENHLGRILMRIREELRRQ